MKHSSLYIPNNLDLQLFEKFRTEFRWKLLFLISTIYFCRVTHKNKSYRTDDFIPLKMKSLGRFIRPNDVKRVRETLVGMGVIECDGKYHVGKKSLGYRLEEKYRNEKVRAIRNPRPTKPKAPSLSEANHQYILSTLQQITILPEARTTIETNINKSIASYNSAVISTDWIEERDWFFAVDSKTGRVFHNIANLNKLLRPYLRYKGTRLAEVDISNSQPLLLYKLYPEKNHPEAKRYLALVESGNFYEFLQTLRNEPDRNKIKSQFLTFLFAKNHWKIKTGEAFKVQFPLLAAIVYAMKADQHNALALALQKLEADLVINKVVGFCREMEIPVVTIHDSLLTPIEYAEDVEEILKAECELAFQIVPSIEMKT